ncbi:hypothetical protein AVEN_31171-1 [Araneus ventricosus]|uniref:Uncharacterized protein n=1 Tax=Araneus ventricosus TaxID=182803 RepID=A0A4Y2LBP6_ARAVE|nr:hypothetical protein AVEN_31171-1 [Araneus ventricosus]
MSLWMGSGTAWIKLVNTCSKKIQYSAPVKQDVRAYHVTTKDTCPNDHGRQRRFDFTLFGLSESNYPSHFVRTIETHPAHILGILPRIFNYIQNFY